MAMPQRSTGKLTANTQKQAMEKQESKERFPTFPQPRRPRTITTYVIRILRARSLLLSHIAHNGVVPGRYLVTMTTQDHGHISFSSRDWMSGGVQPISVSLRGSCFEVILLLGEEDWIRTDLGSGRSRKMGIVSPCRPRKETHF